MWIAVVALGIGGIVVAEVAPRTASGALGRNHVAGIRLPSTMRSDAAWAAAHAAAARVTIATGWITTAIAVIAGAAAVADADESWVAALLVGACALLLVGVLLGAWIGVRAARSVEGVTGPRSR